MKLNVGCGDDYREGFINIDGSDTVKTDKIIDISKESITNYFLENSIEYILANDIIEHHFHWEAIKILKDFYTILKKDAILEIKVPNCEFILNSSMSIEEKLTILYGGQDVSQGNIIMDESRKKFPEYFCHKYGWTNQRLYNDLTCIGYQVLQFKPAGTNIICIAKK